MLIFWKWNNWARFFDQMLALGGMTNSTCFQSSFKKKQKTEAHFTSPRNRQLCPWSGVFPHHFQCAGALLHSSLIYPAHARRHQRDWPKIVAALHRPTRFKPHCDISQEQILKVIIELLLSERKQTSKQIHACPQKCSYTLSIILLFWTGVSFANFVPLRPLLQTQWSVG